MILSGSEAIATDSGYRAPVIRAPYQSFCVEVSTLAASNRESILLKLSQIPIAVALGIDPLNFFHDLSEMGEPIEQLIKVQLNSVILNKPDSPKEKSTEFKLKALRILQDTIENSENLNAFFNKIVHEKLIQISGYDYSDEEETAERYFDVGLGSEHFNGLYLEKFKLALIRVGAAIYEKLPDDALQPREANFSPKDPRFKPMNEKKWGEFFKTKMRDQFLIQAGFLMAASLLGLIPGDPGTKLFWSFFRISLIYGSLNQLTFWGSQSTRHVGLYFYKTLIYNIITPQNKRVASADPSDHAQLWMNSVKNGTVTKTKRIIKPGSTKQSDLTDITQMFQLFRTETSPMHLFEILHMTPSAHEEGRQHTTLSKVETKAVYKQLLEDTLQHEHELQMTYQRTHDLDHLSELEVALDQAQFLLFVLRSEKFVSGLEAVRAN